MLARDDNSAIQDSEVTQDNICQPANWYAGFLERNDFWRKPYDHNHLKIRRVIRSLRLLVDEDEADAFRIEVCDLLGEKLSSIPAKTREFFDAAVEPSHNELIPNIKIRLVALTALNVNLTHSSLTRPAFALALFYGKFRLC